MKLSPTSASRLALLSALLFVLPAVASASSIYMETLPGTVSVGDTIVVRAYLDTDAAPANAVDGSIDLSLGTSTLTVKEINLAGSVLTLWPRTPSLSADGKSITFTGGVPGGFSGSHQLLFSIIVTAHTQGTATLTPADTLLYLNDGKATAVPVSGRALTLAVGATQAGTAPRDEWQAIISGDTTPPEPFIVSEGQDPTIFGGQKYLFFQTTDVQSGIDHYEVVEGAASPVRSGSTYVLQDQTHSVSVTVYAYDKAGNVRASVYDSGTSDLPEVSALIAVLAGILYVLWRMVRRRYRT